MIEELNKLAKAMRDMSDMVGDHHWMAAKAVEGLIRLRGEIAKRDAKYQREVYGLNNEGDPIGGDPAGGYANDNARLRTELAALKAQGDYAPDSVVWIDAHHVIEGNNPSFIKDVALVSAERTSETQIPLVRLNAAPVQRVSVPDGSTNMQWPEIVALVNEVLGCEAHKYPCERGSIGHEMTGINFNSLARIIDRVRHISATPAAPAADAGLVEALEKIAAYAPCSGIKDPVFTKMHMGILARDALAVHRAERFGGAE